MCTWWERTNIEWIRKPWLLVDMWECSSQEDDLSLCAMLQVAWKIGSTEDGGPPLLWSCWGSIIQILWSRHVWAIHNKTEEESSQRYGSKFTCTSCLAVHIEITHSLDTDSFILALRCLIARRRNVQSSQTMVANSLVLKMSWDIRGNGQGETSYASIRWWLGCLEKEPSLCQPYGWCLRGLDQFSLFHHFFSDANT